MKKVTGIGVAMIWMAVSLISVFAIGFDAEKTYESVVVVSTNTSLGSGFAVEEQIVITNVHVLCGERTARVTTYGKEKYSAAVVAVDAYLDLAILRVQEASFAPLPLGDETTAKIGDDIFTIGAPNSMAYTLTKGVISAKERSVSGQSYIQIDAPINQGNSGGPLLDNDGRVLGINTLKMSDSEGIGMAIPVSRVKRYLEDNGFVVAADGSVAHEETNAVSSAVQEDLPSTTGACEKTTAAEQPASSFEKAMQHPLVPLAVGLAAVGAVTALVLFMYNKNKNRYIRKIDPSDRTDFEIDIWE